MGGEEFSIENQLYKNVAQMCQIPVNFFLLVSENRINTVLIK